MSTRDLIDVFVVFAGPDRDRAAALCRELRAAGLRVFSEHDLKVGDVWDTVLPARLRAARAVVILISEKWGSAGGRDESWYGPEEVALAIRVARKAESPPRVIPVLLDGALDCTPYGLLRVRAVQVAGDAFADAATEIAAVIDPTDADPPARKRDAVAVARERVENLRHGGASDATIRRAEAEVLTARRAARDGVAPREGEVFAERYLLIERLGDGGFATVWLAYDQRRGERVAVKVLHGRWRHDRSRIERFERGAMRMASLTHDAVVRVLEKPSSHDGWHYYVMEYLPGGDLAAARTRAEAPLSADEAIGAVLTVADALAEAHRRGMVHRDVKPQNILLDASGRAKISDFDLVGVDDSTGGTRTGALGTFLFAAPEALAAAKDATAAADVYGLAVTTVFALLGRVPAEVVRRPEAVVGEVAALEAVKMLLMRSLAWDPEVRPVDAEAFAAALRRAWTAGTVDTTPTHSTRRWPTLAVCAIFLVVAVVSPSSDGDQAGETSERQPFGSWLETLSAVLQWWQPENSESEPPEGFAKVSAGTFMMGSPHNDKARFGREEPRHWVRLSRSIWVAAHEVTQAEWRAAMSSTPSYHLGCDRCPVERVNWFEAAEYANRRSRTEGLPECYTLTGCGPGKPGGGCPDEGKPSAGCLEGTWQCDEASVTDPLCEGYRLPTEAEWEYFARAGTTTPFSSGEDESTLESSGWTYSNSYGITQPVGGRAPNEWLLYDVHGNVSEWTGDWQGEYSSVPIIDPVGPTSGVLRVFRGGSSDDMPRFARSAYRGWRHPGDRSFSLGFRLVRFVPKAP